MTGALNQRLRPLGHATKLAQTVSHLNHYLQQGYINVNVYMYGIRKECVHSESTLIHCEYFILNLAGLEYITQLSASKLQKVQTQHISGYWVSIWNRQNSL